MAMQVGGGSGGVKSDINVTPLVDVMLVLLIIMMIVAPLLNQGVAVRLPLAAHSVDKPDTQDQTVLTIDARGGLYVNARDVSSAELQRRITEVIETRREKVVIIKADEDVEYRHVMDAMDELRLAGIEDMGLITESRRASGQGE